MSMERIISRAKLTSLLLCLSQVSPGGPAGQIPAGQSGQAGQLTTKVTHNLPPIAVASQQQNEHFKRGVHGSGFMYRGRSYHLGRRFACSKCPCTFVSKGGLNEHVKHRHENRARYTCEYCGKGFTNQSHRSDHLATHTGVKQNVCTVCNKQFTFKHSLKAHVLKNHPS